VEPSVTLKNGTLARVAGRRVTESGSRAFLRYIKTVPCVVTATAAAAAVAAAVATAVAEQNRGKRKER